MAHCPAYSGTICSLCCSLDARCEDSCKESSRLNEQVTVFVGKWFSPRFAAVLGSSLARYMTRFILATCLLATVIGLVYYQETLSSSSAVQLLQMPLLKLFLFLTLIAGVTSWLFVLAQETRHVAREESMRQNLLLTQEVEAHQKTDAELKRAKEVAEAANLAKSRYLSGISHELRTPLNVILGYAQLLGQDEAIPASKLGALKVIRRSSEHLSVLIDGLLDMAKIEAGKLVLRRDAIAFPEFVEQLVQMFELQAQAKGLHLTLEMPDALPAIVYADEKRLRQILINLLSNAITYTEAGSVTLRIGYHSPLVEFEVKDTGPGIEASELQRIFEPFERSASAIGIAGTGLGLTISNLLARIMGGDISVNSVPGEGSVFRVRMLLAADNTRTVRAGSESRIAGYLGARRKIMVVDDDPDHRMLMHDTLQPLGFTLFDARNGEQCLELLPQCAPDLLLLDISMPGIDGWEVIRRIRARDSANLSIIIISANAFEGQHLRDDDIRRCDFLVKPVVMAQLFDLLQKQLCLDWVIKNDPASASLALRVCLQMNNPLDEDQIEELVALGNIGYVRGIEAKLASLHRETPAAVDLLRELGEYARTFQFNRFLKRLEALRQHAD